MTRLEACLLLRLIPTIGNVRALKIVIACKTPEAVFEEDWSKILTIDGIGATHIAALKRWKEHLPQVQNETAFIEKHRIGCLFYGEEDYPSTLTFCPDAPLVLFYKGKIWFSERKFICIVGTRQNTLYGRDFCEEFISFLKPYNPVIVSGFAFGIDIIAHQAAIKQELDTVGCLAHGFNRIYPPEHRRFITPIERQGGFITDFLSSEPLNRNNFSRRNRIMAGLSHATIVIESGHKGGSINTADLAHQYGRELFAVPGRVTDVKSKGCHDLIVQQKAQLLCCAEDFITAMGWNKKAHQMVTQKELFIELSPDEQRLYDFLKVKEKESLDNIALNVQMPISKTATMLIQLEMKGCIRPLPGKYFECI